MSTSTHSRLAKVGLPPGTLLHVGEKRVERTTLTLVEYNAERCEERVLPDVEACASLKNSSAVHWLNIEGLHDVDVIRRIGEIFGIHPLVLEDIVTTG